MLENKLNQLREWFAEKAELIKLHFESRSHTEKLVCRLGDIYLAKLGVNVGNEVDKQRPVLVFQGNDWYLKKSDMIFVFPITSNTEERKKYQVNFSEKDIKSGHVRSGSILVQQGRSISKFRLGRRIGIMQLKKLREVQQAFDKVLYKNTPLQPEDCRGTSR